MNELSDIPGQIVVPEKCTSLKTKILLCHLYAIQTILFVTLKQNGIFEKWIKFDIFKEVCLFVFFF